MVSSGSPLSANGVKPRRSVNTETISRRWLRRNDSSPVSTTSWAICGDRKRRSRPSRSSSATWAATRSSSFLVPLGERLRLRDHRVVVALDPHERTDPGQQLGLVERLGDEVVGPDLDRADLLGVTAGRHHDDRDEGRGGVLADPAAGLVAVHPGHHDVEQDDVGQLSREQVQRRLTGRGGQHREPSGESTASIRRTFWGRSSTTRTVASSVVHGLPFGPRTCRRTRSGRSRTLIGFSR